MNIETPTLLTTTDGRYCRRTVMQSSSIRLLSCSSPTLEQLPCACSLPVAEGGVPHSIRETVNYLFKDGEVYKVTPMTPQLSIITFEHLSYREYLNCDAYLQTGGAFSAYLKSVGAALSHAIISILATIFRYLKIAASEVYYHLLSTAAIANLVYATSLYIYLIFKFKVQQLYTLIVLYFTVFSLTTILLSFFRAHHSSYNNLLLSD
ncbi:hypothetical protein [Hubei permutotetra-like virus 3]|uniref:hypothetical protein n=1 Tax=Hubei permutotetra-like virus 3 TaxID=1923077 RepID=UPI00090B2CF4|nr:hypothetical protein [Hubei permutotetra-like virus 3]APG76950.1 hypothetical protein [Hubei permutotetra-like virus 3]